MIRRCAIIVGVKIATQTLVGVKNGSRAIVGAKLEVELLWGRRLGLVELHCGGKIK